MSAPVSALDLLTRGEIAVKGRLPWSTNATFLVEASLAGERALAVYKPGRGERPLWDFPPNLYRREVAAWALSEALGWGLVPLTVERDGPMGEGSLQLFVRADLDHHYFTLRQDPAHRPRLERICVFDVLANNADRKGGHCLLDEDGVVWAIDNALTFHVAPKLRTVIWDFRGEPIPAPLLDDVARVLGSGVPGSVAALLEADERRALLLRARALLESGRFPEESGARSYPWPLV